VLAKEQLNCAVNSIGSMFQIFFTSERVKDDASAKKANSRMFRKLFDELLKQNIFIPPSQFETCFVSYAHAEDDVDKTIEAYGKAFREVKK
jgi:glutamate-1-semialdehyde 2,1-aminomutase